MVRAAATKPREREVSDKRNSNGPLGLSKLKGRARLYLITDVIFMPTQLFLQIKLTPHPTACQLEERQSDWAYSRPVVILDLLWNLAFVAVALSVLLVSSNETPQNPLRLWIAGYAVQCLAHITCVWTEYKSRRGRREGGGRSGRSRGVGGGEGGAGGEGGGWGL